MSITQDDKVPENKGEKSCLEPTEINKLDSKDEWLEWDNPTPTPDITNNTKTGAIYMRVSTANQEEDGTIENQWVELKARIIADKISLPQDNIYADEGWSGSFLERPDLDRLRNDAKDGKFQILYLYDRGRLARDQLYQEIVLRELRQLKIEIIELHGINGTSNEAKMMGSMMGIFHEYERLKILERFRLGRLRIVKENHQLLGYSPCYGYDLHRTERDSGGKRRAYFTINPEQAEVVRYIFEMVADGKNLSQVRKQLKEDGIKTARTNSCVWNYSTLYNLVRNTTYIGEHYYNKREAVKAKNPHNPKEYQRIPKSSMQTRPKDEWWQVDNVEPIISKELFDKVQIQLKKNAKHMIRNTKRRTYLLSGLIKCECGKARTGDPTSQGNCYYRCKGREDNLTERTCFSRGINVAVFDAQVWHVIRKLLTQPELIAKFSSKLLDEDDESSKKKLDKVKEKLKKLSDEEDRYIDAFGKGFLDEEKFKVKTDEIKKIRRKLETEEIELRQLISIKPDVTPETIAANMKKLLADDCDFEKKQFIIRTVIDEIVATPEHATITGKIPVYDDSCFLDITKTKTSKQSHNLTNSEPYSFGNKNIGLKLKDTYAKIEIIKRSYFYEPKNAQGRDKKDQASLSPNIRWH